MKNIAVISLSGGMDSTCLLARLLLAGYEVYGLAFDYGQKHKIELERLQKNVEYLKSVGLPLKEFNVINISQLGELFESSLTNKDIDVPLGHYEEENMKSTVVPNRNAIFTSIIYGYALSIAKRTENIVEITLGVHSGDHAIYPDCRPAFYEAIEEAFDLGNYDSKFVQFTLPYINSNKTEILKECYALCIDSKINFYELLRNTNTSYNPDEFGRASGLSGSDIERIEAFINNGLADPVEYVRGWDWTVRNAQKIINSIGN